MPCCMVYPLKLPAEVQYNVSLAAPEVKTAPSLSAESMMQQASGAPSISDSESLHH